MHRSATGTPSLPSRIRAQVLLALVIVVAATATSAASTDAPARPAATAQTRDATRPAPPLRLPLTRIALPRQGAKGRAPRQITIAPVPKPATAFAGRMTAGAKAQVRALPAPQPVGRGRMDAVSMMARVPPDRAMRASPVIASAHANAVTLARMQKQGMQADALAVDLDTAKVAVVTQLAVASNPAPAVWGNKFPESGMLKLQTGVFAGRPTQLTLLARTTLFGAMTVDAAPHRYVMQYVAGDSVPVDGAPGPWQRPAGLLASVPVEASVQATPRIPFHAGGILGVVPKRAAFGYLVVAAPPSFVAASPASIYVRVVPVAAIAATGGRPVRAASGPPTPAQRVAPPVAIGAPSNWIRIDVPGTQAALQAEYAQQQAELAKANQELAEQKAAEQLAQQQAHAAEQATKDKAAALWIEQLNAQLRIKDGYDVELLSYVPPKFSDDTNAAQYLVLATDVNWNADGSAFVWLKGESYQAGWALNLMQSNVAPMQQMWLLAQGIINGVSEGYESAKLAVVGVVADAISGTGLYECLQACRDALKKALEFALAYCGIPPSIPNTRELYREGGDYLAASLANAIVEQGIGVELPPGTITDAVKAEAKEQARAQAYKGAKAGIAALVEQLGCPSPGEANCGIVNDNPYSWGVPDPYFRARPAVIYLRIKPRPGANLAGTSLYALQLEVSGAFVSPPVQALGYVPPEGMVVPVVLTPQTYNWTVTGYFTKNNCDCGQPVYGYGHDTKIRIHTIHVVHSVTGNADFSSLQTWDDVDFDGAYVQDFQDGDIYNGYKGELKQRQVDLP